MSVKPISVQQSLKIKILLKLPDSTHVLSALTDSGAEGNFIDLEVIQRFNLPMEKLQRPVSLKAVDSGPVGEGLIPAHTLPIELQVGALHFEHIIPVCHLHYTCCDSGLSLATNP